MNQSNRNALRAYIESDSGKEFLMLLLDEETSNLAQMYSKKITQDEQMRLTNRNSGIYWVRTLIQELVKPEK